MQTEQDSSQTAAWRKRQQTPAPDSGWCLGSRNAQDGQRQARGRQAVRRARLRAQPLCEGRALLLHGAAFLHFLPAPYRHPLLAKAGCQPLCPLFRPWLSLPGQAHILSMRMAGRHLCPNSSFDVLLNPRLHFFSAIPLCNTMY